MKISYHIEAVSSIYAICEVKGDMMYRMQNIYKTAVLSPAK